MSVRVSGGLTAIFAVLVLGLAPAGAFAAEECPNEALRVESGSAALSNCRAWEMVSPPEKNGSDIAGMPTRTRAAEDGSAVQYMSVGAFADARGTSIATEYMAIRTGASGTNGWATHAITPGNLEPGSIVEAISTSTEPRYMGEFSPNLSTGVFFSNTEFTGTEPNVAENPNLYLRRDLRTAGAGTYQLLSACAVCAGPLTTNPHAEPYIAGASSDFSHVIFESPEPLTADTEHCVPDIFTGCPVHLYEWSGSQVRLAGWIPPSGDTQCGPSPLDACVAADASQAGRGQSPSTGASHYTPNTISQDGSRIIFTVPGSGQLDSGKLYMRVDNGQPEASTVQINASERTTPETPQDATYWGASVDGSKVFFTTRENLIDSDNANAGADLYQYDVEPNAQGHHLMLLSPDAVSGGADVAGMIGASVDGSTVYFVAHSQLVQGQPTSSGSRIFRWHDGILHHVVKINVGAPLGFFRGWATPETVRVSPDGNHLLFVSQGSDELSHTGVGDTCGASHEELCEEVFLYDATTNGGQGDQPVCVSCRPGDPNAPLHADAGFSSRTSRSLSAQTSHLPHPMSDDGRYAFFDTGDALLPSDQNGSARDVYEYDSATGQLHLISSGKAGSFGGTFDDASPSGLDVFFATRDKLSPWDIDDNADLYDARVGGGVPSPPVQPPACEGASCRGGASTVVGLGAPGSVIFSGAGNKPAPSGSVVKVSTRAQKLAKARRACKKRHSRRSRKKCESQARARVGAHRAAKHGGSK